MNLFIIIKAEYFNQILNGTKKEEYRIVKPYWAKKIVDRKYSKIIFQNGYSSKSKRLQCNYDGYEIKNIRHDFFGREYVSVFALKLSKPILIR